MDIHKRSLQIGAAAVVCALALRLLSNSVALEDVPLMDATAMQI